eukprot:scaffold1531_cov59-Phaeocystis_antarctica.AAC.10
MQKVWFSCSDGTTGVHALFAGLAASPVAVPRFTLPHVAPHHWYTHCVYAPPRNETARIARVDASSPLCADTLSTHNESGHAPRLDHPATLHGDQRGGPPRPQSRQHAQARRRRPDTDPRARQSRIPTATITVTATAVAKPAAAVAVAAAAVTAAALALAAAALTLAAAAVA